MVGTCSAVAATTKRAPVKASVVMRATLHLDHLQRSRMTPNCHTSGCHTETRTTTTQQTASPASSRHTTGPDKSQSFIGQPLDRRLRPQRSAITGHRFNTLGMAERLAAPKVSRGASSRSKMGQLTVSTPPVPQPVQARILWEDDLAELALAHARACPSGPSSSGSGHVTGLRRPLR
jgi:hypothetical protein